MSFLSQLFWKTEPQQQLSPLPQKQSQKNQKQDNQQQQYDTYSNNYDLTTDLNSDDIITSSLNKAIIPDYLYTPLYGRPRLIDPTALRYLVKSPYVYSPTETIKNEIAKAEFDILPNDGYENIKGIDELCQKIKYFIKYPNSTKEDFVELVSKACMDEIELGTQVWVKVYNLASYENLISRYMFFDPNGKLQYIKSGKLKPLGLRELVEIRVYDCATFTMNPDIHGTLPIENAYWQYYNTTVGVPISFNKDEIMYVIKTPLTYNIYGRSPLEVLEEILTALMCGETTYKEYFTKNETPSAIISLLKAEDKDIIRFKEALKKVILVKDKRLDIFRRKFFQVPVTNREVTVKPLTFTPQELDYIKAQEWFNKLVLAVFGINPSYVGFTEGISRATDTSQARIAIRKAVSPYLRRLEINISQEILPEFGFDVKNINGRDIIIPLTKIVFKLEDLDTTREKEDLFGRGVDRGAITIDEYRSEVFQKTPLTEEEKLNLRPKMTGFGIEQSPQGMFNNNTDNKDKFKNNEEDEELEEEYFKKKSFLEIKSLKLAIPDKNFYIELNKLKTQDSIETFLSKELISKLDEKKKYIINELENFNQYINKTQKKSVLDDIIYFIRSTVKSINLEGLIKLSIAKSFEIGLKNSENELNLDFIPNQDAINFISNYTFDNVKNMTNELEDKLRQVLQRAFINKEGIRTIIPDIKDTFDITYTHAKTIAVTETNRAFNEGKMNGYKQSGLTGEKEWDAANDACPRCKKMNGQRQKLDDFFYDEIADEKVMNPPDHVNCRCSTRFIILPETKILSDAEKKAIDCWEIKGISKYDQAELLNRTRQTIYNYINSKEEKQTCNCSECSNC